MLVMRNVTSWVTGPNLGGWGCYIDELHGEMNKIKPHTFDYDHKKDEDVETYLLGMRKYFQMHNYSVQAEGRISIYQLKGKASM
jgi:hypothetical protein